VSAGEGDTSGVSSPPIPLDRWAAHPRGRLFTRTWTPPEPAGAPIVLLHDSLGSVELWRDFPAALCAATSRAVIAYDRLGFGRSGARPDRLQPGFVAEEAASFFPALREAFAIDRFVLFGHSVGGGMAIECAARFGADCDALITEAAQAFTEDRTLQGIRAAREQFQDPEQLGRLARWHGDKARWVLEAWTQTWLSPGFADWTLATVLPRVHCPVLALHGEHDEFGSRRHPETIRALAGGPVRMEILPDTNHVPHRERPARVLAIVADFLAGTSER